MYHMLQRRALISEKGRPLMLPKSDCCPTESAKHYHLLGSLVISNQARTKAKRNGSYLGDSSQLQPNYHKV